MEHLGRTWYVRLEQTPSGLWADFGTWALGSGTQTWDKGLMGRELPDYSPRTILAELYSANCSFQERWV